MTQTSISARAWVLMGILAFLWGGSFLSNRIALEEVGVFTTVAARVAGAATLMWLWVLMRGIPVPRSLRFVGICALLGALNNAVPFTLIVWGQQYVASGLAGILNAVTAIFGVVVAALVFADEKLTPRKGIGVALGFAGVTVTIGVSNLTQLNLTSLGQIAILGSSLFYAISAAIARVALRGVSPQVATAGMLTGATIFMVPMALSTEGLPTLDYSIQAWGALIYLAALASAVAYLLYYTVLDQAGAGNLLLVTLLVAPVAIVLGAIFYDESLALRAYVGFALLALGLLTIDGRLQKYLVKSQHPKEIS